MNRIKYHLAVSVLILPLLKQNIYAQDSKQKPNILIIFTDDQGYEDFACLGSKTNKTPVMDQFMKEGTFFSSFYAQPTSGPSRSALLTGRYPIRSKAWDMPAEEVTFAELAKTAGYQTACIGKWEVSSRQAIIPRMPNAQGFDYYFGPLGANDDHIAAIYRNNDYLYHERDMSRFTKMYTEEALDFLKNKRNKNQPFLLYLAHTMMHSVVGASEDFRGKSKRGLYGDAVEEFDYETGRLLKTLKELGLDENTLIIYTTDNGPWNQQNYINFGINMYPDKKTIFWGDSGALRGGKGSVYEAGSRVPCIMRWKGKIPAGERRDGLISTLDFMPSFATIMGFTLPQDVRIDGVDQTDYIFSKTNKSARRSFCYTQADHKGFCAIRDERWKLILPNRHDNPPSYLMDLGSDGYELYDLKNDRSEKINLIKKHPQIVKKLKKELEKNK